MESIEKKVSEDPRVSVVYHWIQAVSDLKTKIESGERKYKEAMGHIEPFKEEILKEQNLSPKEKDKVINVLDEFLADYTRQLGEAKTLYNAITLGSEE